MVVRLTNVKGLSTTQTYTVQVRAIDVPPLITSIPPTLGAAGQTYDYAVHATDVDGDPLTYHLIAFDTGMTIDAATGEIQWTPTAAQIGIHLIAVGVDDGQGGTAMQSWILVIASQPPNQPPVITSSPPLVAGAVYQYAVAATDPEGSPLSFSLPECAGGDVHRPRVRRHPVDADGRSTWVEPGHSHGHRSASATASQTFSIDVVANHAPVITSTPPTTAPVGLAYQYDVHATDADGDSLVYALTTAPAGMTIDSLGRINWLPQVGDIGSQPVLVTVSDGRGGSANQQFTIAVAPDTQAPQVISDLERQPG